MPIILEVTAPLRITCQYFGTWWHPAGVFRLNKSATDQPVPSAQIRTLCTIPTSSFLEWFVHANLFCQTPLLYIPFPSIISILSVFFLSLLSLQLLLKLKAIDPHIVYFLNCSCSAFKRTKETLPRFSAGAINLVMPWPNSLSIVYYGMLWHNSVHPLSGQILLWSIHQ